MIFLGVDMKYTVIPLLAKHFESSKNGIKCPMANHGIITTLRGEHFSIVLWSEFIGIAITNKI